MSFGDCADRVPRSGHGKIIARCSEPAGPARSHLPQARKQGGALCSLTHCIALVTATYHLVYIQLCILNLAAPIETLVHRCVEKDPRRRLRDIGDARAELEDTSARDTALPRCEASEHNRRRPRTGYRRPRRHRCLVCSGLLDVRNESGHALKTTLSSDFSVFRTSSIGLRKSNNALRPLERQLERFSRYPLYCGCEPRASLPGACKRRALAPCRARRFDAALVSGVSPKL